MSLNFPIAGQGIFVFKQICPAATSVFQILNSEGTNGLNIQFTTNSVIVTEIQTLRHCYDAQNNQGLSTHNGAYYWFSLDAQNQQLYAGIGEARMETTIYSYLYPNSDKNEYENTKKFLESLTHISFPVDIECIRMVKDPITQNVPLLVKNKNEIIMDDIASGKYMPVANLPPVCQNLYNCIAGEKFVLDTPDFPDFTQAIEYSIRTPGKWCYQKLLDKSTEFNPDKPDLLETYLRITLGQNNGESPGIPYVMEIWPVGHYSPIHSHANANAMIRVLNGEINVNLFPFLCGEKDGVPPFGFSSFKKGDVTWITTNLNATHQLKNLDTNTYACITIQCYMYSTGAKTHYDYFDYLDDTGGIQQYEPDSDMDFIQFKAKIREEWNDVHLTKKHQVDRNKSKQTISWSCFSPETKYAI